MELTGEAEKLAKRLHPHDEEAPERHAIDAILGALERPLAAEVQKLGCHTMENVVATARRIEKILEEQTDPKMECLISPMQDQIRLLKKDLTDAREQIATPIAALTATPASTVAATQPPPPASARPPPPAPAQPPPPAPARHSYQGYPEETPHYQPPRRQSDRRSPRCFLCGEEGHLAPTVRPAQSSSASYASKCTLALAGRLKDESWSRLQPTTAPKNPLTYKCNC